jgi:hypothetical protein
MSSADASVVDEKSLPPPMYIVACFSLAIVFTLAGLSKFGITSDGLFISHDVMKDIYYLAAPKVNGILGTSYESEILRHAVGYFELASMALLMSPFRFFGVILGLILMVLVVLMHILIEDFTASFYVHIAILVSCLYAIYASRGNAKSPEKVQ